MPIHLYVLIAFGMGQMNRSNPTKKNNVLNGHGSSFVTQSEDGPDSSWTGKHLVCPMSKIDRHSIP